MTEWVERLRAIGAALPLTTCVFMTVNEDGTFTSVGHGPVSPAQRRLVEAIIGPPIVAQLLSAAEAATAHEMGLGLTVAIPEDAR